MKREQPGCLPSRQAVFWPNETSWFLFFLPVHRKDAGQSSQPGGFAVSIPRVSPAQDLVRGQNYTIDPPKVSSVSCTGSPHILYCLWQGFQWHSVAQWGSQSWLQPAFSRPSADHKGSLMAQEPPERRLRARLPAPRLFSRKAPALCNPSAARTPGCALYSSCNACDGWMTAARTAGNIVAQTATAITQAAAPEIDIASHGVTP